MILIFVMFMMSQTSKIKYLRIKKRVFFCSMQGSYRLWNSGKTMEFRKGNSIYGKTMEFEQNARTYGKTMEFSFWWKKVRAFF